MAGDQIRRVRRAVIAQQFETDGVDVERLTRSGADVGMDREPASAARRLVRGCVLGMAGRSLQPLRLRVGAWMRQIMRSGIAPVFLNEWGPPAGTMRHPSQLLNASRSDRQLTGRSESAAEKNSLSVRPLPDRKNWLTGRPSADFGQVPGSSQIR